MKQEQILKTRSFGKKIILNELLKRGLEPKTYSHQIILNNCLVIDFKTCNYDNNTAKRTNCFGGFDRINPARFDYLICVSFDGQFNNIRYFIFSKKEAGFFKDKNSLGLKNLTLITGKSKSEHFAKSSEDMWSKLKK